MVGNIGSLKMERRRLADILGNQRGGFDVLFGDEPIAPSVCGIDNGCGVIIAWVVFVNQ